MRISDWSSDVCSSDLVRCRDDASLGVQRIRLRSEADGEIIGFVAVEQPPRQLRRLAQGNRQNAGRERIERPAMPQLQTAIVVLAQDRSEEHTSEPQSLMRNSYATFCLNKKRNSLIIYQDNISY